MSKNDTIKILKIKGMSPYFENSEKFDNLDTVWDNSKHFEIISRQFECF